MFVKWVDDGAALFVGGTSRAVFFFFGTGLWQENFKKTHKQGAVYDMQVI